MARLTEEEIDCIKREADLAAVVRSRGVALSPQGGDLVGLCPFHDDKTPSLHVTPAKRLWRCTSCQATGNVIQFVQRFDGVSFRHAADLLASGATAYQAAPTCGPVKKSTVPKLPNPLAGVAAQSADDEHAADQEALRRVVDYYAERLATTPAALAYLEKRGLAAPELLRAFRVGFCDRTLGLRMPNKNRAEGAALRGRLARLGVMRETGHEHFRGQVTVPVIDARGVIGTIYGRATGKVEKHERHRFLPGPQAGVFNPAALAADALRESGGALILTEGVTDALTWWAHGYKNVTTCFSARKPSADVLAAIVAARVSTVFLSFDPDGAGEAGGEDAAAVLLSRGVEVRRIRFPAGHDANSYALAVKPPRPALAVLLNAAEWLGKGRAVPVVAPQKSEVSADAAPSSAAHVAPAPSSLAAKAAKAADVGASAKDAANAGETPREAAREETPAPVVALSGEPTSTPSPASSALVQRGEHWFLELANPPREWRVGGLEKTSGDALKIALRLRVGDRFHLDALDLARDAERRRFVERAAEETALHADLLRRDVARLLFACEATQAELAKPSKPLASAVPTMTAPERAAALDLLRAPDLLKRILADLTTCGLVGEDTNKLVGYLAAVSRLLPRPLAIIVRATSAAGKSSLMDAILALMPSESRVKYSALTGQALYYLGGETSLRNKILAIVEEEGAEKASYALKLLQSEGELAIASTGKDPHTGRMVTQEYRVEGPVMIILTTTAVDLDEELLNRCIVLTVDESREQTAAIHAAQRRAETLAGLAEDEHRAGVLALHRNAQRLLRPLKVVNPYGERLTFLDDRTRTRRDHKKYLTLIRSIALLHQHQRPIKTMTEVGRPVDYIEVTLEDIAAANRLAHDVLGRCLDDMPPQTRRLLGAIQAMQRERAKAAPGGDGGSWRRRELRAVCGWGDSALKLHLARLVELEYVIARRDPEHLNGLLYELVFDGDVTADKPHLSGLLDVEKLRAELEKHAYAENRSGQNEGRSGVGQPSATGWTGVGQPPQNAASSSETPAPDTSPGQNARSRSAGGDAAAA
jgi:DNA primase catalytic core